MTTFDETVELIKVIQVGKDKYKNPITEKVATEVFCNEKSEVQRKISEITR